MTKCILLSIGKNIRSFKNVNISIQCCCIMYFVRLDLHADVNFIRFAFGPCIHLGDCWPAEA